MEHFYVKNIFIGRRQKSNILIEILKLKEALKPHTELIRQVSPDFNPIRSGVFQIASDSRNIYINLCHIIHVHFTRCFRHVPIRIFLKFAILTILQRF